MKMSTKNYIFATLLLAIATPLHAQHIGGEVYGGGHDGEVRGTTSVEVTTGDIGKDNWVGTPYGGVFGGGEGDGATVTGETSVKIHGGEFRNSIYGGGKRGNIEGNASVEVTGGTIKVNVYGGARMADINGYTYVFVHDDANTSVSPVLGSVYGGNDIAGNVKNQEIDGQRKAPQFYDELSMDEGEKPSIVPTTFVRIGMTSVDKQPYIGTVYGGSDGGYTYVGNGTRYDVTLPKDAFDTSAGVEVVNVSTPPVLDRTFIHYDGGTVGNIFAGGDNVTVTDRADIHLHSDQAKAAAKIPVGYVTGSDAFLTQFQAEPESYTVSEDGTMAEFKYQINRAFGGNNHAAMDIRPDWHLHSAHVNNLYAGGNKGDMTYPNGIYITVSDNKYDSGEHFMIAHNVFGGCRLSDVHPSSGSIAAETIDGFDFPAGYAARVLILGGKVYNVYGGNDVSGQVYQGANVVIRSNIIGNVYGSGNGSYAYYSSDDYDDSDFFFQTNGLTGVAALNALNAHRPNTENVLIDLAGTPDKTIFIAGNVFCGGNSATLRDLTGNLEYARAKIKMGSYVTVNGVFLGSNGEQMLNEDIIIGMNHPDYNPSIDLTQHEQMAEYMKGVEVAIKPSVEFPQDYVPYSTYIGSFYCGGNKGSMTASGTFTIDFLKSIRIFEKLVAGSNDANVQEKTDGLRANGETNSYANHSYVLGGLTAEAHPKVQLNLSGLQVEPKKITYDDYEGTFDFDWNRYQGTPDEGDMADYAGFMHGANIYGGCYNSGYVNGDVVIDISESILTDETLEEMQNGSEFDWDSHVFEPFISTITCYGGGYGTETEIWGNTTVNLTKKGHLMKIRGGGEKGWVGKMMRDPVHGTLVEDTGNDYITYAYNDSTEKYAIKRYKVEKAFDSTVHVDAELITNASGDVINNVAEMCAGGFEGIVTGNTHAIVDNGCVYTVFGGASNAHIYGSAETLLGQNGTPYITQTVYGGNDFGGQIMGTKVYETKNENAGSIQKVKCNAYVEYFSGEIGYGKGEVAVPDTVSADFGIFGGGYGWYDYRTPREEGNKYFGKANSQPNLLSKIIIDEVGGVKEADFASNTFVNISSKTTNPDDKVMRIYGGGQGYPGKMGVACTRQTYVLFNAANANARPSYLAQYVFGAGDCARTWYSRLDAYAGNAKHVFGANRGIAYYQVIDDTEAKPNPGMAKGRAGALAESNVAGEVQDLTYMGEYSVTNVYPSLNAPAMDVFASGAFSGTKQTFLNLYGGTVNDVYGASIEEGITYLTEVNVPKGSTLKCNGIYGGGKGLYEDRPCDTYVSTIRYNSEDATVEDGIYGGNRNYRFTRRSMVSIDVPVRNSLGELVNVYGGGKGEHTISEITFVALDDGAKVRNVFGGSCEGLVYNKPAVIQYMLTKDYYKDKYTDGDPLNSYCLGDCEIAGFNTWKNQDGISDYTLFKGSGYEMSLGELAPLSMGWTKEQYDRNTDVQIRQGAIVTENAYGAGYGDNAATAGVSVVQLLGGTVMGNIYGGGFGGNVVDTLQLHGTTLSNGTGPIQMDVAAKVYLNGGTCTNSYGSGLDGDVIGDAYTYLGHEVCGEETVTYLDGDPAISRSVYGGGENGKVTGTAYLNIYNGHVGYSYDESADDEYVPNVHYVVANSDSILYDNGNAFGGGYGEDAKTRRSEVIMTGGVIRNSLYGGGEIATIGDGVVTRLSDDVPPVLDHIVTSGEAHVSMYGGHVLRDVFGGGRGYSYDLKGNEVTGNKFYTDGYVFGKTDVNIYRGEVGTGDKESLDRGYGNVFGGGNVGFVYSGTGVKRTAESDATHTKGYYYDSEGKLTEDSRVVVSPYCKVTDPEGLTIAGVKYGECEYVPTEALDKLLAKGTADDAIWAKMDYITGVTIHNAVFAGGNVTRGDSKLSAEVNTIYGNATATLNDVYHRDLITVGTEHIGGLYGDGNLTKVDGYREICIANYGTDYYGMKQEISADEYYALNDREKAYFQLMYKCVTPYEQYTVGTTVTEEVYRLMKDEEKVNWTLAGFCSVYAGRLLNTIQRADFVGVHGSRIVLQGAQDRTVDVVDYMDYAINRVGEVSLNQRAAATGETGSEASHGNYFGMYSVVNFLQALTSDVDIMSERVTESQQHPAEPEYPTYYTYKEHYQDQAYRNNASSPNEIALASGVYLEIVDHLAPAGGETIDGIDYNEGDKVYGPITGVVELELINLGNNLGGAFVYAKNEHGTRSGAILEQAILSDYNEGACTNRGYTYDDTPNSIETSGNFVHSAKQIIDDCYPGADDLNSPAHYWFLRGTVYVYDQYISAFTGSSTAYKSDVNIPLTITAGSHGQLKVLTVQPNLYAYYKEYDSETSNTKLAKDDKMVVNGVTYQLNDIITYWDWSNLGPEQQKLFIHDTYLCLQDFSYDKGGSTVNMEKGDAMTLSDYEALPATVTITDEGVTKEVSKAEAVHISNGMRHSTGYALTADISNPDEWSDRYIKTDGDDIITTKQYMALSDTEKEKYFQGPSYKSRRGVYGQSDYAVGDIVSAEIVNDYKKISDDDMPETKQATMEDTYISVANVSYIYADKEKTLEPGVGISKTEYDEAIKVPGNADKFNRAYVCNSTVTIGERYIINGDLVSKTYYDALSDDYKIGFSEAFICTEAGKYGGTIYEAKNYDALRAWCDLAADDRSNFEFNYDAFDLFWKDLDPDADIAEYDKPGTDYYSRALPIEYTAIALENVSFTDHDGVGKSYNVKDSLDRVTYEKVPNEKIHYSLVKASELSDLYVVNKDFYIGGALYSKGTAVNPSTYSTFTDEQKANVTVFTGLPQGDYYYCREAYEVNESGEGKPVTNIYGTEVTYDSGDEVPEGILISKDNYDVLPNLQVKFRVTGVCPVETSTLYVARDADVNDVLKDRVVTVVYQYQYEESNVDGSQVELITEEHVLNIHLEFRPGAPSVGRLKVPGAVIPGTTVGLKQPSVSKGAYEIIGGGWELYDNLADASNHINGQPYVNNSSLVYFYQNGQYVAYYAKTYMGKTYSNPVQFTVANYHSINDVMADTEHHMYIDHEKVPRNPKIYIDDDQSKTDDTKSEIDLLKDLYDLSTGVAFDDHAPLKPQVANCDNLDFILQSDVTPKKYTDWTPIGNDNETCFGGGGFFHGDGHTVYGLNKPLFGNVCAEIYNLGVSGSFTGPGVANYGEYAANCWTMSSAAHDASARPILGNEGTGTAVIDNCYYYEPDDAETKYVAGNAIRKTLEAFNNGEVAFNLNKYYLLKRYNDHNAPSGEKPNPYSYFTVKSDNSLQLHQDEGFYDDADARIQVTYTDATETQRTMNLNYTEFRYFDGDFVNADGKIHTVVDERHERGLYYPIFPDDYIFFGQNLNYGYIDGVAHDSVPEAVVKTGSNRLLLDNNTSNRVYRAIAYNGSMDKNVAHFNVACVVPDYYYHPLESKTDVVVKTPEADGITISISTTNVETFTENLADGKLKTTVVTTNDDVTTQKRTITTEVTISEKRNVYPNMTGLDFTGSGDLAYAKGLSGDVFFAPVNDYRTLIDFANPNQSRNMLVYADGAESQGYKVLSDYLFEPRLEFTNDTYKNVPKITDAQNSAVQGHLVKKSGDTYITDRDHFLVDENNFHCPISYNMGETKRMWYQRTPCTFADGVKGYESIILPFNVELVSAHQKGELTHFYDNHKANHEYWLRGYQGVKDGMFQFIRPMNDVTSEGYDERYVGAADDTYTVANDFLYDYYYSNSEGKDGNQDIYQKYYQSPREYEDYICLTANVPYIIAFPGDKFYEFDMSGEFTPGNTFAAIPRLDKQNVSFCSGEGAAINVIQPGDMKTVKDGYTFQGIFQKTDMTADDKARILTTDGDKFAERHDIYLDRDDHELKVMQPFHAYLTGAASGVKEIFIGEDAAFIQDANENTGELEITSRDRAIFVTSHMSDTVYVQIVNAAGQQVSTFAVAPGRTMSQEIPAAGVYMVNNHKIIVR